MKAHSACPRSFAKRAKKISGIIFESRDQRRVTPLSLSLSLSLSTMLSDLVPGLEEKFNFTSGRGVEDAAGS